MISFVSNLSGFLYTSEYCDHTSFLSDNTSSTADTRSVFIDSLVIFHSSSAFTISGESLNFLTVSASSPFITAITLSQKDTSHFTHFVIVDNFHLAHFTVVYILFHASFIAHSTNSPADLGTHNTFSLKFLAISIGFIFSLRNVFGSVTIFFLFFNHNSSHTHALASSCLNSACLSGGSDCIHCFNHGVCAILSHSQSILSANALCHSSGNDSIPALTSVIAGSANTDHTVVVPHQNMFNASSDVVVGLSLYWSIVHHWVTDFAKAFIVSDNHTIHAPKSHTHFTAHHIADINHCVKGLLVRSDHSSLLLCFASNIVLPASHSGLKYFLISYLLDNSCGTCILSSSG